MNIAMVGWAGQRFVGVLTCAGAGRKRRGRGAGWRKIVPILGVAVLLAWGSSAWADDKASVQDDHVLRATLDNGLRVVIVPNPLAPVVTTVVNYLVGSNDAPEGFPGMAHAQEHMMFRGSPNLSADQLANIMAAMGGNFNANTQQTVTQYVFTVPAEDLEVALHVEAIRMRGVLDDEALWAQERGGIEQEVAQDLSNPQYILSTKLLAAMFKGTVYAHDALGTRDSFAHTTGAMLKQFYDTWYAPNNAILVIVGDVQPREVLAAVKALFGAIPAKKLPQHPNIHLQPVTADTLHLQTDLPYGLAVVTFRLPGSGSPDFAAARILADVLSSQRGLLYALVPEGKALYTDFSLQALPQASLGYALAAFPKGSDASALVEEVRQVMVNVVQHGVAADLVEAAKRHRLTSVELHKDSVPGLAMVWSQALAVQGRQSPQDDVRAMNTVAVADVNRVAQQFLTLDQAIVAILTPEASGQPVSNQGFGGTESFAPKQVKSVTLPAWAEKALQRLAVPASTVHPVVTTLPNGLRLIVQPESSGQTVNLYGHIKNNPYLQVPPGQEGVEQVLEQFFDFGTTALDRVEFQRALDDIGANESAGTDFALQVLVNHFERGVHLLAEHQLHPALPESAFTIIQPQTAAAVAGQLQSPDYLAEQALKAALVPKNDPTLREATPATIASLTLQDVRQYYQQVFRPDMTTIVVIGRISPEVAHTVVATAFGSWQATGPKPTVLLPPVPFNTAATLVVPNTSRVQDQVFLAQALGLNRSNPDYYALELGNHVLGGAFYATRLYQDLRESAGLVYYVSSVFDVGETRAMYAVHYACDPTNVSKARAIIERNLRDMQTTPVRADELQQAKALVLREIPLSEASLGQIASGLLSRATHDLPLDEPTRAAQRYIHLTAEQLQAAFVKWLRPADLVQIAEGPHPE